MAAPVVVYVHGLWLTGYEGFLLQRRIEQAQGFQWRHFPYASTILKMDEIADALHAFVAGLGNPETLHFLGHSLGGLVIMRCLERHPLAVPGRVVFLGTPSLASKAATEFARYPFGPMMLGEAALAELINAHPREWLYPGRELGIIAGDQPIGLARLVVDFDEPNDGAVAVSETRLPGAKAHIVLPVTHTGMLLSQQVAAEAGTFLATGAFTTPA
jgi:pimeloyl-ACP methyl ester carboxylesterase